MLNTLTHKNNTAPIAFFDSGVGGLTVYSKFKKLLPNENCIYFGDLKHLPYGNKTKEELITYSRNIFNFFQSKDVKAVVMACNTSSAATYSTVSKEYGFKIYPIIQSCASIIAKLPITKLGIFATQSTISSGVYESEINKYNPDVKVFSQSCPEWVNIVETTTQNEPDKIEIIKSDLEKMLENNPDKIVLGCTHYPYLLDVLSKFSSRDLYIDPAEYFVEYIKEDLGINDLLNAQTTQGSEEFYVSANPEQFELSAKMFYNATNTKKIDID